MGAREQGREGAREGEGGERVLEREGRSRVVQIANCLNV